jgi:hypothetical protein
VLEFFEQFFMKSPVTDFRLPINLSSWFDPQIIQDKRKEIAEVVKMKIEESLAEGKEMPMLPEISFHKETDDDEVMEEGSALNGDQVSSLI